MNGIAENIRKLLVFFKCLFILFRNPPLGIWQLKTAGKSEKYVSDLQKIFTIKH